MIAVFPGSFDPVTNGHMDVIERAGKLFDKLIIAVLNNYSKSATFTPEERLDLLKLLTKKHTNIEVISFDGLLVEFAKSVNASVIIRGLRTTSDFEYELKMALANRSIKESVETLFISTDARFAYLSSSLVKEVVSLGGSIDEMVPLEIKMALQKKLNSQEEK